MLSTVRRQHSSPYYDNIYFLWTWKRAASLAILSTNIVREICSYQAHLLLPVLAVKNVFTDINTDLVLFDVQARTWSEVCLLGKSAVSRCSCTTFTAERTVFACGGGSGEHPCNCYLAASAFFLEQNCIRKLPNMHIGSILHGLVLDPATCAVYVFGGYGEISRKKDSSPRFGVLRSSEKFSLSTLRWETLPDMVEPRMRFNPCIYASMVYICGGGPSTIEIYDPKSNGIFVLPDFTLPELGACISVSATDCIVMLTMNYICRWSQTINSVTQTKRRGRDESYSRCSPVMCGRRVYYVAWYDTVCEGVNLETGDIDVEVRYKTILG